MNQTAEEVLKFVEDEDVKFIRLAFRDAYGVQKNISVMPGEVVKAFEEGIPINARQVAGFRDCPYASLYLKPETDTMSILPWRPDSGRVLRLFCDLLTPDGARYNGTVIRGGTDGRSFGGEASTGANRKEQSYVQDY